MRSFVWLLGILLSTACAKVEIKNTELCWDAGNQGAICENTLKDEERVLTPAQWEAERFGRGCMTQADFGEIKAAIEKLCSEPNRCTYEFKKKFQEFVKKHEELMKKLPKTPTE